MIMAKTSRVAPILLEALDAEDNELLLSRELDLSKGFHLPPIKVTGCPAVTKCKIIVKLYWYV